MTTNHSSAGRPSSASVPVPERRPGKALPRVVSPATDSTAPRGPEHRDRSQARRGRDP